MTVLAELRLNDEPPAAKVRVMDIGLAADLYLGELARQGKSRTTINRYRRQIDKLEEMYPHLDVNEITITQLRRYLDREAVNRRDAGVDRNSDATVAQKISIVKAFFYWLWDEEYIPLDPSARLKRPKLKSPEDDDSIVSVSGEEVGRMLAACNGWQERICLHVLVYTGARRHAVALLRLSDYSPTSSPPTLRFREKGGKTIVKPIPARLAELLNQAFTEGVWEDAGDDPWLIPPRGTVGWARQDRYGARRDDRIIWRTVRDVSERAGVKAHVHSLRAAFAVFFLESHPDCVVALQALMGHARPETTNVYLRRLNRRVQMETVVDLDWDARNDLGDALLDARSKGGQRGGSATPAATSPTPPTSLTDDLFQAVREAEKEDSGVRRP